MFNPLLGDLTQMKQEDLLKKINELATKYAQATNFHLKQQVLVILEQYRQEYRDRMAKQMEKDTKALNKIINIE